LSGKAGLVGYAVSHAHNRTKKVQRANLQWKRLYVPEEGRFVRVRLSTRALRSVTRKGLVPYLKGMGLRLSDVT
jgi:large subunit ribosomal protein L28